ncbi:right-handed parallel beta-helix repeat-containing protein [Candidatus Uabimicrobium sp. HlEnr_7]|uniref:right-handed parallel beta-helix repeat-containing protein n=1 Tax=Candidatus Uabimicrobium helgolandensis TaxID=3095367 RepID=UPI0035574CE9
MKINAYKPKSKPKVKKKPWLFILCFLLTAALTFFIGFYNGIKYRSSLLGELQLRGFTQRSNSFSVGAKNFLRTLVKAPSRYLQTSNATKIYINIKFKHFDKLQKKRRKALFIGRLIKNDDDYVPAKIVIKNKTFSVKLRLKGDDLDHLKGNKLSMRIKVREGKHIFGMRRFSLQAPRTKGYQAEALIHDHMRTEGIIAPRYFFVETYINGSNIGVMAVEEHFSKEIQEFNQRREGIVFRLDESLLWESTRKGHPQGVYDSYSTATLKAFHPSRIAKNPLLQQYFDNAIGLFRGFLEGKLEPEEVFDLELFGKFFAINEIWNTLHGLRWNNMRFYYNPITTKIEPVSFDINANSIQANDLLVIQHRFATFPQHMMRSNKMRKEYIRNLHNIIPKIVNGNIVELLRKKEQQYLKTIFVDSPMIAHFSFSNLVKRAQSLSQITIDNITTYQPTHNINAKHYYPQILHAYLVKSPAKHIEIHNIINVPIEIEAIQTKRKISQSFPIELPATLFAQTPQQWNVPYEFSPQEQIVVVARIKNDKQKYYIKAVRYPNTMKKSPLPQLELSDILKNNAFLALDKKRIVIKKGEWVVKDYIAFPNGINLHIEPGCTLNFAEKAGFLVHGALLCLGTKDAPIHLQAAENKWRGIVVMNAKVQSQLSHVHIKNTKGHNFSQWTLTGAITFYKSNVHIRNSTLENNDCEDALNIVQAKFSLQKVNIFNTVSDAFDADFTTGSIKDCHFKDITGDAIDTSGSQIKIENTLLENAKDKALSFGEKSNVQAKGIQIHNCGTGIAVKDTSFLEISRSTLHHTKHVALMAYIKKSEFAGARIIAKQLEFIGNNKIIAQTGSEINIDNKDVVSQDIDIDKIYKDGYMKKDQ